jgi:hypothetical protein
MAKLSMKIGSTEFAAEGGEAFIKDCRAEFLRIVEEARLSPAGLKARDEALATAGGLQADMELLDRSHRAMVELNEQLSRAVKQFSDHLGRFFNGIADGAAGSAAHLSDATKQMQETQMSFNLQYLQLQNQMQNESRSYTAVSNIMKTKHDTVKNSISNIR